VAGIVTTLWAVLGHRFWKWVQRIAVTALLLLCCVMTYVLFSQYGWDQLTKISSKGSMPFMVGLDLVIAMPMSWLPLVCDYSRFARSTPAAFWGTWIGYFIVSSWMYILGLSAALATGSATPESMVLQLMVGMGLALPAIIIVLFSTFTTTFLDIYSTAVSSLNIWPALGERRGSVLCGILGTALALVFPATAYESFLLFIGSVFCPLFGIVLADFFVLRRGRYFEGPTHGRDPYWYSAGFNPWAFAAWAGGFGIYHILQRTTSLGASIPSLVIAGLIYLALMALWRGSEEKRPGSGTAAKRG